MSTWLQGHRVLGRPRRLAAVLGARARAVLDDRDRRRTHKRHRDMIGYVVATIMVVQVFFLSLLIFTKNPFATFLTDAARRRQGPQPAAPELLDGDPSAVALHRLRRGDDPVRVRHRRARVGPARRHVARLGPRVDADLLRLPLARPHPRRPLGVRGARLGRLLGVGSRRERRASCRGSPRPRSSTPRSSRSSAG